MIHSGVELFWYFYSHDLIIDRDEVSPSQNDVIAELHRDDIREILTLDDDESSDVIMDSSWCDVRDEDFFLWFGKYNI